MALADPNDDILELADGTKIRKVDGTKVKDIHARGGFIEIPSAGEAVALVAKSRRSVAELPMPPGQMNMVSLVLFYSMFGLSDQDMALVIGNLSSAQVKEIKKLPEYQTLSNDILKSVMEYEANDIRTFLQQNAKGAAMKIVELVDEEGALGFAAAKDVLDRAGHRPADVVEHKHKFEDSLKIEYIERNADINVPVFEGDFRDVTPGKAF